jgi:SAM-dependent methyltransferase
MIAARGFQVTGIDGSSEMIRFARQNAPGVSFTVSDAREFSLGNKFDGAFSVFESLNHVPDLAGLTMAFSRVLHHLKPGASFLFDLNGEDAFLTHWNETNAIVDSDQVCVMRSEYNEETQTGTCRITSFRQNDGWTRNDFVVRQTCHEIDAVHDALLRAGFDMVGLYDARDAGMTGDIACDRTFFLATAK